MPGRKEDSIAVAAFAEIEITSAFGAREGLASDLEIQTWCKWSAYFGCWVNGWDVVEELQSGGQGEDGLAECMILYSGEKFLATHGRGLSVVAGVSWASRSLKGRGDRVPLRLPEVRARAFLLLSQAKQHYATWICVSARRSFNGLEQLRVMLMLPVYK